MFDCIAYVHIPNQNHGKLDPCAVRCVFVGYVDLKKAYRCYDPHTQKLYVTQYVTFHENVSYFLGSQCPLQRETPLNHNYEDGTQIINGQVGTQPLDYTQTIDGQVYTKEFDEVDHQLEKNDQSYDDQPRQRETEQIIAPLLDPSPCGYVHKDQDSIAP